MYDENGDLNVGECAVELFPELDSMNDIINEIEKINDEEKKKN